MFWGVIDFLIFLVCWRYIHKIVNITYLDRFYFCVFEEEKSKLLKIDGQICGCTAATSLWISSPHDMSFNVPINLSLCDLQCILDHSLYKYNMLTKCVSNKTRKYAHDHFWSTFSQSSSGHTALCVRAACRPVVTAFTVKAFFLSFLFPHLCGG